MSPRRHKEPTSTGIVYRALCAADDFRTLRQLIRECGLSCNRVSAALHHLRARRAVDVMDVEGQLWWFATPDTDNRSSTVDERTPETHPRRPRRTKKQGDAK